MQYHSILLCIALFLVSSCLCTLPPALLRTPLIFAHRGNSVEFPENTIEAFLSAQELLVDVLQFDAHLTSDHHLVVFSDPLLSRTTNGTGPVEYATLAEIKALDAGYWFSKDSGKTHPFRGKGMTIPTFEEVLARFPTMHIYAELQTCTDVAINEYVRVVKLLYEGEDAEKRVIVRAADKVSRDMLVQKLPLASSGASVEEAAEFMTYYYTGLLQAYTPRSHFLLSPPVIDSEKLFTAVALVNQRLIFWVINNEAHMTRLLKENVHGFLTDNVRLATTMLNRHN